MRQPTAWAILVVGVGVSLFTCRTLRTDVDDAARGYFESTAAEARNAMETRLRGYRVALRGMQGLFQAGEVDALAFQRYASALGSEARSLSFARRVTSAERDAYEKSVRRIHPPGERAEYLVLHFVEPLARSQGALGLDLFADAARRQTIERARDTGSLVASPPFVLVVAPDAGKAVSLRLPVLRRDMPLNSLEARRRAFAGIVSVTFLIGDLAEDAVARHATLPLRIVIREGDERLYDSNPAAQPADALITQAALQLGDRNWQLEFSAPLQRFRSPGNAALPWLALAGGILISLLLAGLVGSLATSSRRAQRIATAITEDLRNSEQRLRMEHAVTRVLAEADSVQAGLKGVMRAICEAEGWDCCRVHLVDEQAGMLRFHEAWGIEHPGVANFIERTRDMTFTPGQGLAGRAWQTGEPVWSGDISDDPRAIRRFASDYGMRGAFCIPLLSGGKTLGVAVFASRVVREPDARLLEAAGVVGSLVGQFLIRKQAEEAVRFVATHDSLTRLPNRVMFGQRLEHALGQAARHGRRLAVLFIDLDRFKIINDTLGHDVGDGLLREVARRLIDSLRASDTVARLGGDEFVVLLEQLSDPMYVTAVAQKLTAAIAQPIVLTDREVHVTASIGASTYPDDSGDAQSLLKNADIAMYRAKESGRNTFQFYSARLNQHTLERLTLESALRRALERGELLLYYQPQVELRSGRISGVEALLRWRHPEHGLLAPGRFIDIAEETGLIVPIGNWVLQTACAAHRAWRGRGVPAVRISVNLSARQFLHDDLIRDIRALVGADGFAPGCLELEITESMVMRDPERVVALLRELRQMGVRVSIDDFGTGHSSLAYLKRFPVDTLKVDHSFVAGVPGDLGDAAIVQAVITMAHNLGMKVIAEGVETRLQRDFLAAQGCDEYQGYFFAEPLPAEEALALLEPSAKSKSSRASS